MAYKITRSIRNNNPGNVRKGANWQGMAPDQTDPSFVQFVGPEWGFRAMARILKNYFYSGIDTVQGIISKWAPNNENDTAAYVKAIAKKLDVDPTTPIDVMSYMPNLLRAISDYETGFTPPQWTDAIINQGIYLEKST